MAGQNPGAGKAETGGRKQPDRAGGALPQTDARLLMAFLNDPKNSLTASGHTDPKPEAPEKEDTAHEEN